MHILQFAHHHAFIWAMVLLEASSICIAVSEKFDAFSSQHRENYGFKYEVNAPETGDRKQHSEIHAKDQVLGSYSIVEPNGAQRYVEYLANSKGFNAIVRHQYRFPGIEKHQAISNEFKQAEGKTATPASTTERPTTAATAGYSYRHNLKMNKFFRRERNRVELSEKRRKEFEKLLQNREYIQSSPRGVSTLDYLEPKAPQQIGLSQPNEQNVRNRQRQYEVTERDLDFIDIRRSVNNNLFK